MFNVSQGTPSDNAEFGSFIPDSMINDKFNLFDYINTEDETSILPQSSFQCQSHVLSGNQMFTESYYTDTKESAGFRSGYCSGLDSLTTELYSPTAHKVDENPDLLQSLWLPALPNDSNYDFTPPKRGYGSSSSASTSSTSSASSEVFGFSQQMSPKIVPPGFSTSEDASPFTMPLKRSVDLYQVPSLFSSGIEAATPTDSENITNLWQTTYQQNRSESLPSQDSGHWSLASSPERKYLPGSSEIRFSGQYKSEKQPSMTHFDVVEVSTNQARVSRSEVRPKTGAARHKRSSHIRAEKKRKAKIESEFDVLKKLVEISPSDQQNLASSTSSADHKSMSRAGQLIAAADKLREMTSQVAQVDYETECLLREKEKHMLVLKSMWESIDVKNQPHTSALSLTEKIENYHQEKVSSFGEKYEIFREFLSPAVTIVQERLLSDAPSTDLQKSLLESVSDDGLFSRLRQSSMDGHTKLLQRFDS